MPKSKSILNPSRYFPLTRVTSEGEGKKEVILNGALAKPKNFLLNAQIKYSLTLGGFNIAKQYLTKYKAEL